MTSGVRTNGSPQSNNFYYRSWSGGNGRYLADKVTQKRNDYLLTLQIESKAKGPRAPAGVSYWPMSSYTRTSIMTSNDVLNLQGKILEQAKGHSFNALVSASQANQTFRLVADTAKRLANTFNAVRKGNIPLAVKILGADPNHHPSKDLKGFTSPSHSLANRWLELQYGWKPLLQDVNDSMQALAASNAAIRTTRVSASIKKSDSYQSSSSPSNYSVPATFVESWRAVAYIEEIPDKYRSLGLQDPASVVWENVPYSFCVDWFIPIGTWLSVMNQFPNLKATYIICKRGRCDAKIVRSGYGDPLWGGCSGTFRYVRFTRESATGWPVPYPSFKPLSKSASVGHMENALALLRSAFSR